MIKAIIFDLDNTLIDFLRMKKLSCEAAIIAMIDAGLEMTKEKAMSRLFKLYDKYGMEEQQIFQKFLTKIKGDIDYKILASGIVAYKKVKLGFLEPYPHVIQTLLKLRQQNITLAIVSDAPKMNAWDRLVSMKIADYFDAIVTFEDTLAEKPSKIPFQTVLRKINVKPHEAMMIGDRPERDIKGAKKMGMMTCFARYGNPSITISGADYEINEVRELLDVVQSINGKQQSHNQKKLHESH